LCSYCCKGWYCSRDCQVEHWVEHRGRSPRFLFVFGASARVGQTGVFCAVVRGIVDLQGASVLRCHVACTSIPCLDPYFRSDGSVQRGMH
jgi:hypothetical protein